MSDFHVKKLIEEFNQTGNEIPPEQFFMSFFAYIDCLESNDFAFNGEGSYFGKQVTISEDNPFARDYLLEFEVVYDKCNIVVYTANHNGFWVKPYSSIKSDHPKFNNYHNMLVSILRSKFGLE